MQKQAKCIKKASSCLFRLSVMFLEDPSNRMSNNRLHFAKRSRPGGKSSNNLPCVSVPNLILSGCVIRNLTQKGERTDHSRPALTTARRPEGEGPSKHLSHGTRSFRTLFPSFGCRAGRLHALHGQPRHRPAPGIGCAPLAELGIRLGSRSAALLAQLPLADEPDAYAVQGLSVSTAQPLSHPLPSGSF